MYKQVIIFAKAPKLGTVKTRLAAGVGSVAAVAYYRQWSASVIRRISSDSRWRTHIAVSPDTEVSTNTGWGGVWPRQVRRIPQGGGDLGQRMSRCFREAQPGPVIIVGSDIPDLTGSHIETAFRMLMSHDAVFGPADDGGYWLIGLSARARKHVLLKNVRWSTEHALDDTLASLGPACSVGMLTERLADIDTVDDLRAWQFSTQVR